MIRLESEFVFVWTIENFRFFPCENDAIIKSLPFRLPQTNTNWYINWKNESDSLICILCRDPGENHPIKFKFEIKIENDYKCYHAKTDAIFQSNDTFNLFYYDDPQRKNYLSSRSFRLTLHFSYESLADFSRVVHHYLRSRVKVVKFRFDWFLHNFNKIDPTETNDREFKMCYASIKAYLKVSAFKRNEYMLYVLVANMRKKSVIQFTITLLNCHRKTIGYAKEFGQKYLSDSSLLVFLKLKSEDGIPIASNLPDDTLKLCFEAEGSIGEVQTLFEGYTNLLGFKRIGNPIIELNQKSNQNDTDICEDLEVNIDERSFKVNKAYVNEASPYFKELLRHPNSLTIPPNTATAHLLLHLDRKVLPELSNFELISTLFKDSRNLQIEPLINASSRVLVSSFSVENIAFVFDLLDDYDDPELRKTAMFFFNANIEKVLTSNAWKKVLDNKPKMAYRILRTSFLTKLRGNKISN